ncbi:MAG: hypothetical protein ABI151_06640, partial [Chitinophagaceae bacterium]
MKKLFVSAICISAFALGTMQLSSCKDKPKEPEPTTVAPAEMPVTPPPAPVVISADDSLTTMLKDATRDYPTVTTSVSGGEVTLTGT